MEEPHKPLPPREPSSKPCQVLVQVRTTLQLLLSSIHGSYSSLVPLFFKEIQTLSIHSHKHHYQKALIYNRLYWRTSSDRRLFWHNTDPEATSICILALSKFSKTFTAQEVYQLWYFLLRFLSTTLEHLALQKLFLLYPQAASLFLKFILLKYSWFTMLC